MARGKKFDQGKVPLELLPTDALWEVAKVLAFGRDKYGAWNWKNGMEWSRLLGAAKRHLDQWTRREEGDDETGLSHLAHAGCCVLFLLTYELLGIGEDDRWSPSDPVSTTKDLKEARQDFVGVSGGNLSPEPVEWTYSKDVPPPEDGSPIIAEWGDSESLCTWGPIEGWYDWGVKGWCSTDGIISIYPPLRWRLIPK